LACFTDERVAKVDLRFTRLMDQGNEDFLASLADFPNGFLDLGVSTLVALLLQPFKDAFGGVALFAGNASIFEEELTDTVLIGAELRLGDRLLTSIARRLAMSQDLLQGLPVDPRLPKNLSFTNLFI